ncbi:gluconokinase [Maribacter algicola]|uniref:Gluconokinase n=1 Tax=Meishania litoralis TaxID=3434685 RepID=A0ACC7LLQ9_9FLAO
MNEANATIFFVMGVSGCGKSTIGRLLAKKLDIPFFDGDDYHSSANVAKMSNGKPLTDEDRMDWLRTLNQLAIENMAHGAVIGCSALKESYRKLLEDSIFERVTYIYLKGTYDEIHRRMQKRSDHFMPAGLLKSQFEALEPPIEAITVSIANPPDIIVEKILRTLGKK